MGQKIFREQELKEVLSEIQKERDVHQVTSGVRGIFPEAEAFMKHYTVR